MVTLKFKDVNNISEQICNDTNLMLRLLEEVGEITYHSFRLDEVDVFPDYLTCNCEEKAIISYIFTDDSRISLTLINQAITVDLIQVLGKLVNTKNKKIGKEFKDTLDRIATNWIVLGRYILDSISKGAVA